MAARGHSVVAILYSHETQNLFGVFGLSVRPTYSWFVVLSLSYILLLANLNHFAESNEVFILTETLSFENHPKNQENNVWASYFPFVF